MASEFPPQPGGIGNHAYNLANNLSIHGYKVGVITDNRSYSGKDENQFDSQLDFVVHRTTRLKIRSIMYLTRLRSLFRQIRSSHIIIASGKFPLWIVAFSSLLYKRKYIGVLHGTEVNFKNLFLRTSINISLQRFLKLIAVSNFTKSLVGPAIRTKVVVVPNGFDNLRWEINKEEVLELKGQPKLITVGNVTERKGQLNVIKHIPELIKEYPQLHYHCVGIPTQKQAFLDVAKELKVDDYITFHGQVTNKELEQLLRSSDVFVMLSSPTHSGDVEGYGIAIIEANFFGLPAIGSTNCGIEDAISDNISGKLVPYNDSKAILRALNGIFAQYEEYQFQAKQWALQHTWQEIVQQYIKEFKT